MPDLSLQLIIVRLLALLIIAGINGGAVAAAAVLLGDKGPKYDGRLTVMPTGHVDLVGTVSAILFGLGWTRPVDIDPRQFRMGRSSIVIVVLAGFAALLIAAAVFDALVLPTLTTLPHTAGITTAAFLRTAGSLSIWFALLSLVPVPPLTGGLLLQAFGLRVPRQVNWLLTGLLLAAVATGVARQALAPAHAALAAVILGV